MNIKEARIVAEICNQADGRCPYCVEALTDLLNEKFPEFNWKFEEQEDFNSVLTVSVEN